MGVATKDFRPAGLAGLHLPKDLLVKIPELGDPQWVQRPAGHWYLPLMFDVAGGVTANVIHYPKPGRIGRHAHDGPVFCYTIEGSWYYPEHPWVAEAGSFAWEPTGDVHTQMANEPVTALFIMHGGMIHVDDDDKPIGYDNCLTLLGYCDQWYRDHGMGEDYIKQFIR